MKVKGVFTVSLLLVLFGMALSSLGNTAPILILILGVGWLGVFSSGAILLKCQFTTNHVCKCCREQWPVVTFTQSMIKGARDVQEELCPKCREEVF
ncbi:hypothetical protein ACONDI_03074 [Natranaerofaba carboxydovora]|nr:hypothetical protein ACONDI_03074 [Natranaerofaba carboxydovora]